MACRMSSPLPRWWTVTVTLSLGLLTGACQSTGSGNGTGGRGGAAPQRAVPSTGSGGQNSGSGGAGAAAGSGGQVGGNDGGVDSAVTGGTAGPGSGGAGGGGVGGTSVSDGGISDRPPGSGGAAGSVGDGGMMTCAQPTPDAQVVSLAGSWDFTPQGGTATKIQVPGGGWVKQGFSTPSGTYRTTITIPDSGFPQTTLLEFGAVNHEATLTMGTPWWREHDRLHALGFRYHPLCEARSVVSDPVLVRGRDAFEGSRKAPGAGGRGLVSQRGRRGSFARPNCACIRMSISATRLYARA